MNCEFFLESRVLMFESCSMSVSTQCFERLALSSDCRGMSIDCYVRRSSDARLRYKPTHQWQTCSHPWILRWHLYHARLSFYCTRYHVLPCRNFVAQYPIFRRRCEGSKQVPNPYWADLFGGLGLTFWVCTRQKVRITRLRTLLYHSSMPRDLN